MWWCCDRDRETGGAPSRRSRAGGLRGSHDRGVVHDEPYGAEAGGRRLCVPFSYANASLNRVGSANGRPSNSMPMGTPPEENPAGTVIAGNPVIDARKPLGSACDSPIGTVSRFWCG